MRILVATHNYPRFAGDRAGAFVARLAAAAAGAGHVVRVVAPHAPGAPERERMDGVDVVRFRYAPERWERVGYRGDLHRQRATTLLGALGVPAFLLGFRRTLRRELRNFSPDAVHAPLPDERTIYEIGSFSKVFTTALLSVLVSQGVLSLLKG